MFIETIKTPGIAHLSYLVGCDDLAAVIDPQLDYHRYLALANKHGCKITHIFETHRNEDFVSGAAALSEATGATAYHGPDADEPVTYAKVLSDGDEFEINSARIKVITTPGHTKDSVCYALIDTNYDEQPVAVFTGDTLFVADVGRTDFYPDEKEKMAAQLYDSLQRLLALGDGVQIYPGHGAGSVCGGGMADREFSTLGYEAANNPMLNLRDKAAFVEHKLNETHYYAPYFKKMEACNVKGCVSQLHPNDLLPLTDSEKQSWFDVNNRPGIVVDVREAGAFRTAHLRDSISLPGDLLSAYGGWVLPYDTPLLLVVNNSEHAKDAYLQLARMGYHDVAGYVDALPPRVTKDDDRIASVPTCTTEDIELWLREKPSSHLILDVRKADEVRSTPFPGALHYYLGHVAQSPDKFSPHARYTCMCGSDKRATVAASILLRQGIKNVDVFEGSLASWSQREG